MKRIFINILLVIITTNCALSQTVYNLVVGGTTPVSIGASQGWEEGTWGGDPTNFGDGCREAQHNWEVVKHRGYLTTSLKGNYYTTSGNPDNSIRSLQIVNNLIEPGQYEVNDNYYEQRYSAQRNRKCIFCRCETSQCCETDYGWSNIRVSNKYVINVETQPSFVSIYNFNPTINQYTICSSDSLFSLTKLVDKADIQFLDRFGDKSVPILFDPKANQPKKQIDTTYTFYFGKYYSNGAVSKKFSIKVIKGTDIITNDNLTEYSVCKNELSLNPLSLIKANPTGGVYQYNDKSIEVIYPKDYSADKININYKVTVGLCTSQKNISIVFKKAPVIKDISTVGTFCNNTKNVAIILDNVYDINGKKAGIVRGQAIKSIPILTVAPKVATIFVPNKFDTLQISNLSEGEYTYYYDLKDLTTNCISTDTFTATIKSPSIISSNNAKICNEVSFYGMTKDVLPKGGIFKPSFTSYLANDTTLNISRIPIGKITVKYTYTNKFGCISSADIQYDVLNRPTISMPNDTTFCEKSKEKIFIANPQGGIWSGQGIAADGTFTPSLLQSDQQYKLVYSYSVGTCSDTQNMYASIISRPVAPEIIGAKTQYCTGDSLKVYAIVQNSNAYKYNFYINDLTTPIQKTDLNIIADKNLKRILAESINSKGCPSLTKTEKRFTTNEVKVVATAEKYLLDKGDYVGFDVKILGDVIKNVTWSFGDNTTALSTPVVHYYYDSGKVVVKCNIITQNGCNITKYLDSNLYVKGVAELIQTSASIQFESKNYTENYIQIYPNPSNNGIFSIYSYMDEEASLSVTDVNGCQIYNLKNNLSNFDVDLSSQIHKSGIYFLTITTSSQIRKYKLIKN